MKAVDTNIAVYAHRPETQFSPQARQLLVALAESLEPWSIPMHCMHEFVAVVSNPKIWKTPSSAQQIATQLDAWMSSPSFVPIVEDRHSVKALMLLMQRTPLYGGMIHDARIVAACQSFGVKTLYSVDRDFSRYAGLNIANPFLVR